MRPPYGCAAGRFERSCRSRQRRSTATGRRTPSVAPMQRTLYDAKHLDFGEAFRAFLAREVLPRFDDWEAAGIVPREVFSEAGRRGFLGFQAPSEFGGVDVDDFRFNAVLGEEGYLAGVAGFIGGI